MSGDAGISIEQGNTPEIRYQDISKRLGQWKSAHSQQGKQKESIFGGFRRGSPTDTEFGAWKGPSGKEYTVNSVRDESGETTTSIATRTDDGKLEEFACMDSNEYKGLIYYKAVPLPRRPFARDGGGFRFYEAGYYSNRNIEDDHILGSFAGYGMDFRAVLKDDNLKKVDVFDTFNDMTTDLEQATQVQESAES